MRTLTLTPLFRQSVGFDRFNDLFESAFRDSSAGEANSYPPYNIEKLGENQYRITMAVAGFAPEELNIMVEEDELTISAQAKEKGETVEYLYKGIATRSFQRKFSLADHMKVGEASIANGLLQINLEREVPEARKPRMVEIKSGVEAKTIEGGKNAKKVN